MVASSSQNRQPFSFTPFNLPGGQTAWIPDDVELRLPDSTALSPADLHYLVYIPWHARYLQGVPPAYRDFFKFVLPYLRVRTTDVHVATCLVFIPKVIKALHEPVDERLVITAFILHDCGWSQLSELEIAHSLGVRGLQLTGASLQPKARHAELGRQLAMQILTDFQFQPPLTPEQKSWIYQAILYHDRPWELAPNCELSPDLKVVCDVDHLWSFTHLNFWQDTVRKGVDPRAYLENLGQDLDRYFVSEAGRHQARQALLERRREVAAWQARMETAS